MAFLYSVIGDNTIENREHLEKLGYTPLRFCLNGNYLYTRSCTWANKNRTWQEPYSAADNNIDDSSKHINCIGNPALFKAVTSMRDDSDKWQFFVHEDGSFVFCDQGELKHVIDNEYMYQEYAVSEFHKASLSELQEHFK